jgi:hypothetical protein
MTSAAGRNGGSASRPSPDDGGDPRLRALLESAAAHPALAADRILGLLRAPRITADLILAISRRPVWMKFDRVRLAIVLHPATPRPVAMSLLSQLRWRDLARVAVAPRLGAPVRGAAEKILLLRLPELALGERVTLARAATRNLLRALRTERSPLVVRALLENPLLQVEDALSIVESDATPGAVLQVMAESARFAASQELRMAIASHGATPPAAALRLVRGMDEGGLTRLLSNPRLPPLIMVAARRRADLLGVADPKNDT